MSRVMTLRSVAEVALGRQRSPQHETGSHIVPYLRAANVKDGELELSDVKTMNFTPGEQEIFALRPGDVLITEGSGSLGSVGASAVWRGELEGTVCFQNTLLRLRPRDGVADSRFLAWWTRSAFGSGIFASIATGANIFHISAERVRSLPISLPTFEEQRRIANFLDAEVGKMDSLISKKMAILRLIEEKIDSRILHIVGESSLANPGSGLPTLPVRRVLNKLSRPRPANGNMITAFRDGQVTARSLRRSEGYTLTSDVEPQGQGVEVGDVVIHGLDGFAGAIGTSEAAGSCSPVYHVCTPQRGGDSHFQSRLLRVLATSGYLGLFATSTRERAVDFRNWGQFGRIPVPAVANDTQKEIGAWIRSTRPLRAALERSSVLAAERRQALINAAVSGNLRG
ncbi:restriction endonuclease subunit S [Micromonospora sp. NPDC002575]|uniref:restriction endonuclease subunit S n=1 Tax=Micromonospora sp. NPDC002575 TaxID=3364222 RepID=UPI0036A95A0C